MIPCMWRSRIGKTNQWWQKIEAEFPPGVREMKNISEVLDIFCILLSMIITWSTHVKNKNKWNFTVKASTLYSMYLNKKKKKYKKKKKIGTKDYFFSPITTQLSEWHLLNYPSIPHRLKVPPFQYIRLLYKFEDISKFSFLYLDLCIWPLVLKCFDYYFTAWKVWFILFTILYQKI